MQYLIQNFDLIIKFGGALIAIGTIWRYVFVPAKKFIQNINKTINDISNIYPTLEKIALDFKPNGGNSLRDVVDRVDLRLAFLEQKYNALVEFDDIGLFEMDKKGHCTWVSESWCKITGIKIEEAKIHGWVTSINHEDREKVFEEWKNAVEQQRSFLLKYRVRENGESRLIESRAVPLRSKTGDLIGYIGRIKNVNNDIGDLFR